MDRLKTVKAFDLCKSKKSLHDLGAPDIFKTAVANNGGYDCCDC